MRRFLFLAACVAFGHGCRCNTVNDTELPAQQASATPAAVSAAPSAAAPTPLDCGPDIAGTDDLAKAPAILLGELHGLRATPVFAIDLACRLVRQVEGSTVTLALEIPSDEQGRIDTFLASPGKLADRTALLAGGFWTGSRDGRSSEARVEMLDQARRFTQRGLKISVRAIDATSGPRDEAMAKAIIAAVEQKRGPVIALVGNLHARTQPGGGQKWMGEFVREKVPTVVSLDNRYASGEAWICTGECGTQKVNGQDPAGDSKWRVERFAAPDEKGFAGAWHIGQARPSLPAVPAK